MKNFRNLTFITGNQHKADYLGKFLNIPVGHKKLDLDEIQSLDLKEVIEHKARQAYALIGTPVLVEDTSLEFTALGKLPGTFIKFFLEELGEVGICRLLDNKDRRATARCCFGYYDGKQLHIFEGELAGSISGDPKGNNGFGWDRFFIEEGYVLTRAEFDDKEYERSYTALKPFEKLKKYLSD